MSLPLILGLTVAAGILLWRVAYLVEWRRSEPGRHAMGYVETSRDDDEPITEVLPVIDKPAGDPSIMRLERSIRQWLDITDSYDAGKTFVDQVEVEVYGSSLATRRGPAST